MTGLRIVLLAVTMAALTVAMPAPAPAEEAVSGPQAVAPASLLVVGVLNSGSKVQWTSYSLRRLRDLRITGFWNVPGTHVQRLEIRAPDGSLYQRLTQPFTTISTPHVAGDGRARGTPVLAVLLVGGTWITEYSLVGDWHIHLYMDNGRTPLASYSFTLTP